ncbi:MAG: hypothetical protein GY765_37475 [bacterium]|nr:hypothetical protein [bacterium]
MRKLFVVMLALILMGALYAGIKGNHDVTGNTGLNTIPVLEDEAWTVTLPQLNVRALLSEDRAMESPLVRFAEKESVTLDTDNFGEWTDFEDGSREWKMKIVAPGMFSLQLGFSRLVLPEGTQLSILDRDDILLDLYLPGDNTPAKGALSGLYPGDEITLKYLEPANVDHNVELQIEKVMQGYRNVFKLPKGYEAAGLILVDGTRAGYGVLVNNSAKDFKPYFLTSFDCLDVAGFDQANPYYSDGKLQDFEIAGAENWQFCFKSLETKEDGSDTWATYQGCTLKTASSKSGFALLEMTDAPYKKNARVVYFGLANETATDVQLENAKAANFMAAGLPLINSEKMILGNLLKPNHGPTSFRGLGSDGSLQSVLNGGAATLKGLDKLILPLLSPYIYPNVSRVACTPQEFEMMIGTGYIFTWTCSSNLHIMGASNAKTFTVRAKQGVTGSGWVRCVVVDNGGYLIKDLTDTFTVEGFRVWISSKISTMQLNSQRTFNAVTPSGCPVDRYYWSSCNSLEYIGGDGSPSYTVKAIAVDPQACVSVTATNIYGDTDTDCDIFEINFCNRVLIRPELFPFAVECNHTYIFAADISGATSILWDFHNTGRIISGQGTDTVRVTPYCSRSELEISIITRDNCNRSSTMNFPSIRIMGDNDGGGDDRIELPHEL